EVMPPRNARDIPAITFHQEVQRRIGRDYILWLRRRLLLLREATRGQQQACGRSARKTQECPTRGESGKHAVVAHRTLLKCKAVSSPVFKHAGPLQRNEQRLVEVQHRLLRSHESAVSRSSYQISSSVTPSGQVRDSRWVG